MKEIVLKFWHYCQSFQIDSNWEKIWNVFGLYFALYLILHAMSLENFIKNKWMKFISQKRQNLAGHLSLWWWLWPCYSKFYVIWEFSWKKLVEVYYPVVAWNFRSLIALMWHGLEFHFAFLYFLWQHPQYPSFLLLLLGHF